MNKLEEALQEKISILEDEKDEHEDAIERIEVKLEIYRDLLAEETGEAAPKKRGRPKKKDAKAPAKKRGRPRKEATEDRTKNKELYAEAVNSLPGGPSTGTTEEQHERAVRRFNPAPRPEDRHGGVRVGSTKGKPSSPDQEPDPAGHKTISMEDDLPEEE